MKAVGREAERPPRLAAVHPLRLERQPIPHDVDTGKWGYSPA